MSIQSDANYFGQSIPFGGGFGGGIPFPYPAFGGGGGCNNNGIGGVGLFGLVGLNSLGDRGGHGHGHCDKDNDGINSAIFGANILGKLGDIEGAVPLAAANIQNAMLAQTAGLTDSINQAGLANLAATAGVKDTVNATATAALINANNNTNSILGAICQLSSKIDQNTITDLQTQLLRAESHGRSRETEVNITQSVNQVQAQAQAQAQQQAQFSALFSCINSLVGDIQAVKQGQVIFNSGTMAASGTQAAANTKVA
jgi:hypothetical protein